LAWLAEVLNPHKPHGVRHGLVYILALAACAVLAGATSLLAISKWAADAPSTVLDRLGARRCPLTGVRPVPAETTIRRLLARLDADALDRAVRAWLADRRPATGPGAQRAVAVDGKSLRGAARAGGRKIHGSSKLSGAEVSTGSPGGDAACP
jgi:hypothetical protein